MEADSRWHSCSHHSPRCLVSLAPRPPPAARCRLKASHETHTPAQLLSSLPLLRSTEGTHSEPQRPASLHRLRRGRLGLPAGAQFPCASSSCFSSRPSDVLCVCSDFSLFMCPSPSYSIRWCANEVDTWTICGLLVITCGRPACKSPATSLDARGHDALSIED